MATRKDGKKFEVELDWYYVQKDAVRKWIIFFVVAAVAVVGGVYAYIRFSQPDPSRRAAREIAEAESLLGKAQALPEAPRLRGDIDMAAGKVGLAKKAAEEGRFPEAIAAAVDAQAIATRLVHGDTPGDAAIMDTGGKVDVQRANRATWESAKQGMKLFEGDFLKTGPNGVAEVMASDGTLYKIREETLFEVHRTTSAPRGDGGEAGKRSEIKFIVGNVDINTGENSRATVKTDNATTDIGRASRVGVDVDTEKNTGVKAYQGSASVKTAAGQTVELSDREQVTASRAGALSVKTRLPDAPSPLQPEDNASFDVRKKEPVAIKWSPVKEASRYRLQIARSRLFIPESVIVDLSDRTKTEAVVALNDVGSFFWRVATLTKTSVASDWSPYRRFRVSGGAEPQSKSPPNLRVDRPQVIANIVTVSGKTDPGASVTVNGEPADTDTTGAFRKIISIDKDGLHDIVVRAANSAGATERSEKVVIQTF